MLKITKDKKVDVMSAKNAPAAICQDGDVVIFETNDCYDNSVTREGKRLKVERMYNPATGPLYVEGAKAGDTLKVEILDIALREWGALGTFFGEGAFLDMEGDEVMRAFEFDGDFIEFAGHRIAIDPMIGVIGVAPDGEDVLTVTPKLHGGNMDCTRIKKGAAVYFPVNCDGALLAMGDMHALMGDGEVFGYGLETSGEVTVRVSVIKGGKVPMPIVDEGGSIHAVASAKTLEEANNLAIRAIYDILMKSGLDRVEAGMLLSMKCNLSTCQIVDPLLTVRASIGKEFVKRLV